MSYSEWHELRDVVLTELETCPAGDTVLAGGPVAFVCWRGSAKGYFCLSPVYDKKPLSKVIKDVPSSCPSKTLRKSIDDRVLSEGGGVRRERKLA
jgi:hypothetical protein